MMRRPVDPSPLSIERRVYTVDEAAKMLGFSRVKTYTMIQRGEIPGVVRAGGEGKALRIKRSVFDRWLDSDGGDP